MPPKLFKQMPSSPSGGIPEGASLHRTPKDLTPEQPRTRPERGLPIAKYPVLMTGRLTWALARGLDIGVSSPGRRGNTLGDTNSKFETSYPNPQ